MRNEDGDAILTPELMDEPQQAKHSTTTIEEPVQAWGIMLHASVETSERICDILHSHGLGELRSLFNRPKNLSTGECDDMEYPFISGPDLEQQSPAVDFIENSLNKYHPAFSTPPSRYDAHMRGFIVDPTQTDISSGSSQNNTAVIYNNTQITGTASEISNYAPLDIHIIPPRPTRRPVEALDIWDSLFPKALDQFVRLHQQEPEHLTNSGQRIRNKTDWNQVFDQVEKAKNEYSKVDSKFRGGFRKVYRNFGDHVAEPLNRMTKLVPGGGDLGAVAVTPIIGCVQILLEAARAASSVRKNMIEAFDQVENMFSNIELFLQIYPGDENIRKASIDLIASTLFAAENVVGFFIKGTLKRFLSATTQRENYERKTIESLVDVKAKCGLLLQEAEKSNMYQVFHATKVNMDRSAAMHADLQRLSRDQVRPHELRNIVHELLDESEQRLIHRLKQEAYLQRKENERLRAAICYAAAELVSQPIHTHPRSSSSSAMAQHSITPEDLLHWIAIPDILAQDFQIIAEKRKVQVPEREQALAEQLIRTRQIKEWLTAPTSSQLLVHGNFDRRAYISGLTLFCMSLTSTLAERAPRFIPLTFFCGLHTESMGVETHTGGRAIMQSFLGQLLQRYDFGSGQIPTLQFDDNLIRLGDVGELCRLFEALVRMLPNYVLLCCIIDDILYYERPEFKDDMATVLSAILKLSADKSISAPVKVLITSPAKTAEVRQPFPEDLILSMDAMARSGLIASSSRLERELGSGLE